jgi:hypothetical protein
MKMTPLKFPSARLALVLGLLLPPGAWAQVSLSIAIAPPPLLLYAQPPVPAEGYIWMPGYWSWSALDRGYYWVPGTWVLAPNDGDLWTPGFWAFEESGYFWHIGYWGPRVGFYGGINYGYGYFGSGYQGGRWDHGAFRYNRAISNVDPRVVHNVYNAPAVNGTRSSRVSFSGGMAGTKARPEPVRREGPSGRRPENEPQRPERQAAPQVRPEEPRAPRVQQARPEPEHQGPTGHQGQPQGEGQPRKER